MAYVLFYSYQKSWIVKSNNKLILWIIIYVTGICKRTYIATATMLFGLSSGASLATVVGVLIEVPVMLGLVKICLKTKSWFDIKNN